MSARAIGSATVSFGLVSIPVKLYSANQSQAGVSFNLLHKKCGGRLKQQYICPTDQDEVVGREDMQKGYEFAKGQYVTFTEDELKVLEEVSSERIDIAEFVPQEKVDPTFYEKAYYLGPDKGGEKAYRLISAAMSETGRCALARYSARGKQYLVMLRPLDGRLVMQQLRYADEVRPFSEVDVPEAKFTDAELKLARELIDRISTDAFKPEVYEDAVKKRVLALIQKKVEGQEVVAAPPEAAAPGQIIDLMDALKASIAQKPTPPSAAAEPEAASEDGKRKPPKAKPPKRAKAGEAAEKKSKKVS